jgi:hypothetical protein
MIREVLMKLNAVNMDEFADLIKACAGRVMLLTMEGDRLIANGLLTAAIGLASFFTVAQMQDVSIECEIPEDQQLIEQFISVCQAGS